jgi:hypothetical protein
VKTNFSGFLSQAALSGDSLLKDDQGPAIPPSDAFLAGAPSVSVEAHPSALTPHRVPEGRIHVTPFTDSRCTSHDSSE